MTHLIYGCRILVCQSLTASTELDRTGHLYEVQEFQYSPGIYFEKIERLHIIKESWKLVVKLDLSTLHKRYEHLDIYIKDTEELCAHLKFGDLKDRFACTRFKSIAEREIKYLRDLLKQLRTTYRASTMQRRRGFIDGIGTLAKSLFGTMDANDEKHINEQINLLETNQQTLQHATKTQLKVINATIAHVDKLENIIERNERILKTKISYCCNKQEIAEHFLIITAVVTELIRDVENAIEYLTYIRDGAMHPKLMPVDTITTHLKEATQQLPHGLYFPFKVHTEWLAIEDYTEISAYY